MVCVFRLYIIYAVKAGCMSSNTPFTSQAWSIHWYNRCAWIGFFLMSNHKFYSEFYLFYRCILFFPYISYEEKLQCLYYVWLFRKSHLFYSGYCIGINVSVSNLYLLQHDKLHWYLISEMHFLTQTIYARSILTPKD